MSIVLEFFLGNVVCLTILFIRAIYGSFPDWRDDEPVLRGPTMMNTLNGDHMMQDEDFAPKPYWPFI